MAADDRNDSLSGVFFASEVLNEGFGTNNVKGSDTEEALWIEDIGLLHDFGCNWDSGIDRIRDDKNICLWAMFCNPLDQVTDNTGVDLEEVVAGHARLP